MTATLARLRFWAPEVDPGSALIRLAAGRPCFGRARTLLMAGGPSFWANEPAHLALSNKSLPQAV